MSPNKTLKNERCGYLMSLARERSGMSRKDVADSLGVNQKTVYNWEAGRNIPDADTFIVLCRIYKVESFELFNPPPVQESSVSPLDQQRTILYSHFLAGLQEAGLADDPPGDDVQRFVRSLVASSLAFFPDDGDG